MGEWTQERRERLQSLASEYERHAFPGDPLTPLYKKDAAGLRAALSEIDRLTARVEAHSQLTEVYRIALTLVSDLGVHDMTVAHAVRAVSIAEDALRWSPALTPPGEDPAGNENFDRIMEGMKDAQAWADSQSPRPPSESDVEAHQAMKDVMERIFAVFGEDALTDAAWHKLSVEIYDAILQAGK